MTNCVKTILIAGIVIIVVVIGIVGYGIISTQPELPIEPSAFVTSTSTTPVATTTPKTSTPIPTKPVAPAPNANAPKPPEMVKTDSKVEALWRKFLTDAQCEQVKNASGIAIKPTEGGARVNVSSNMVVYRCSDGQQYTK